MSSYDSPLKKNVPVGVSGNAGALVIVVVLFSWLLSFAQFDMTKFEQVNGSFRDALGLERLPSSGYASVGDKALTTDFKKEILLIQIIGKIGHILEKQIAAGEAEVVNVERGLIVRISADALFLPSSLNFRDDILPTLQQLGTLLAGVDNEVFVSGYTDAVPPPAGLSLTSNWGYSAAMAAHVVQYLSEQCGVAPVRLQALGLGQFSPRKSNATEEDRAANRRVELFVSRVKQPEMIESAVESPKKSQPDATPDAKPDDENSAPSVSSAPPPP
ncbi:MAG: OmpA family protein [Magnetococcales bacterium]|nr:OmpA family protein [Magnetococcales bacterium]